MPLHGLAGGHSSTSPSWTQSARWLATQSESAVDVLNKTQAESQRLRGTTVHGMEHYSCWSKTVHISVIDSQRTCVIRASIEVDVRREAASSSLDGHHELFAIAGCMSRSYRRQNGPLVVMAGRFFVVESSSTRLSSPAHNTQRTESCTEERIAPT